MNRINTIYSIEEKDGNFVTKWKAKGMFETTHNKEIMLKEIKKELAVSKLKSKQKDE